MPDTFRTGLVSLVGAGPGDPDLLTRKAAQRLHEADVVLYDALVDPAALDLAPQAQRFFVGKRAGRPAIRQETIHALMIRAARRGRRVVRLKCGDPFVFGRGGEEALALVAAGIPFEVVPGISAAVAAPELAGIPVPHRGIVSAFVVVSGHAESAYRPVLDALPPRSATVVVLMGLGSRADVARRLLDTGWDRDTPSAVLLGASTREAHTWTGRLADLGEAEVPEESIEAPGTLVIGDVVTLSSRIATSEIDALSAAAAGRGRRR